MNKDAMPSNSIPSPTNFPANTDNNHKLSLVAAISSYTLWGILPIYWKLLKDVPSIEVMAHRIFWSFLMLLIMVYLGRKFSGAIKSLRNKRIFLILLCTSSLLATNWVIYIWAVNNNRILEASLGYYINPLLNILFGVLIFKDRPGRLQFVAIIVVIIGVAWQVIALGHLPWVSLALAFTFSIYGVLRKVVEVESTEGLFLETAMMTPFVIGYFIYLAVNGTSSFGQGATINDLLLVGTALITTFPLIWFAYSARRLSLITIGLIQYITPTMAFLLGVFVYKEHFSINHLASFVFIWLAVIVYSYDSMRMYRVAHPKIKI